MKQQFRAEPDEVFQRYECNKCKGHAIYLSITYRDKKGTLMCLNCGESADAAYGIKLLGEVKTHEKKYTQKITSAFYKT
jgi:transcription elongation factor Elf1